jgi:CDP-diacylglycerol--serine O-phosphatidyltransferase
MMVSRVPTFSLKRVRIQPHMILPTLVIASAAIAGLVVETWLTLSVLAGLYVLSIPFSIIAATRLRRREPVTAAPAATPAPPPAPERIVSFEPRSGTRPG